MSNQPPESQPPFAEVYNQAIGIIGAFHRKDAQRLKLHEGEIVSQEKIQYVIELLKISTFPYDDSIGFYIDYLTGTLERFTNRPTNE